MALAASMLSMRAETLDLYWVDVEGGAATLIVTPAKESILIDSGNPGERDASRIHKAAKDAGLERIDHLITTHFHIDHFGGAAELSRLIPIGTVYDYGIPEQNPDNPSDNERFARSIAPYRDFRAEKRVVLKPGDEVPLKQLDGSPPLALKCLGGKQKFIPKPDGQVIENPLCHNARQKQADTSDNANSLVLLLSLGNFEMFDGGDLTWNTEAQLACPVNLVGPVDVYDVNHHGLDVSNNPLLIRALSPTVAVMGNGTTKGCGPETFATLKSVASIKAIYQAHKNLRADSENNTDSRQIANLEKDCAGNYIKISVQGDGKSYQVSIPANGYGRTFHTR